MRPHSNDGRVNGHTYSTTTARTAVGTRKGLQIQQEGVGQISVQYKGGRKRYAGSLLPIMTDNENRRPNEEHKRGGGLAIIKSDRRGCG